MGLFGRDTQTKTTRAPQSHTQQSHGPHPGSTTTIAEGARVSGEITGSIDLRIEGEFDGSISISGIVFVAETGQVRTSIQGSTVTVAGRVDGDIFGNQMIELEPSAVVTGDLLAPKILIREGASLQGRVEMASPPGASQGADGKKKPARQGGRKSPDTKTSKNSGSKDPKGDHS